MALPAVLQKLALPVVASPMFIVSYPELVLAQCKAGIVGSFPALNARPAELLDEWAPKGKFDFEEFASHFPITVMCRILGASAHQAPQLRASSGAAARLCRKPG